MLALKNLLFTLIAPGTVGVLVPWWISGGSARATGSLLIGAGLLLALGASIYGWCVWDFASFGRGTPAPIDAPKRLVTRGLYRYSRNPMYVGVLTVILGWSAYFQSTAVLLYAVAVFGCFSIFIRFYEEPRLHREFGSGYEGYVSRVGRWLPKPRHPSK